MATKRSTDQGRRSFLISAGAAGLGVALGSAGAAQLKVPKIRAGDVRPVLKQGFSFPVPLAVTTIGRDAQPERDEAEAPGEELDEIQPATREQVLQVLSATATGGALLENIGVGSGAPGPLPGGASLRGQLRGSPARPRVDLESAYARGIRLDAAGVISPEGTDLLHPPVSYNTSAAIADSWRYRPDENRVVIQRPYFAESTWHGTVLEFRFRTPEYDGYRTYSIEMDFRGTGDFAGYGPSAFEWGETSTGTHLALVRMRGIVPGSAIQPYRVGVRISNDVTEPFLREFRWVNVISL